MRRGEGVGLVLSPEATRAWRLGGEEWEPVSSRIVTGKLRTKGGRSPQYLFLVSVYAPTFRASDEEKEYFFSDLRNVLDATALLQWLVIGMQEWGPTRGMVSGAAYLGSMDWGKPMRQYWSFCLSVLKNLANMNTFFQKRKRDPQAVLGAPRHLPLALH